MDTVHDFLVIASVLDFHDLDVDAALDLTVDPLAAAWDPFVGLDPAWSGDELDLSSSCGSEEFLSLSSAHPRERCGDDRVVYTCSHCCKQFKWKSDWKKHLRTHTGVKPCRCRICGQAFADPSVRCRHERAHSGIKAHSCTICSRTFTRKWNMERHMTQYHPEMQHLELLQPKSMDTVVMVAHDNMSMSIPARPTLSLTLFECQAVPPVASLPLLMLQ